MEDILNYWSGFSDTKLAIYITWPNNPGIPLLITRAVSIKAPWDPRYRVPIKTKIGWAEIGANGNLQAQAWKWAGNQFENHSSWPSIIMQETLAQTLSKTDAMLMRTEGKNKMAQLWLHPPFKSNAPMNRKWMWGKKWPPVLLLTMCTMSSALRSWHKPHITFNSANCLCDVWPSLQTALAMDH